MQWDKYDKDVLTPYEKTGSKAREFNPETIVFSYMAVRHVAYHAYKAGFSEQNGNQGTSPDLITVEPTKRKLHPKRR